MADSYGIAYVGTGIRLDAHRKHPASGVIFSWMLLYMRGDQMRWECWESK